MLVLAALSGAEAKKRMVCYYTNWSGYRQGLGKYTPDNVDATLCTHIMYSVAFVANNKISVQDSWLDIDNGELTVSQCV